jgi:hypothetical protein
MGWLLAFFCADLPLSGVVRLLVGEVSAITISPAGGGESGSLLLFLEDLAILDVDLCRQEMVREFVITG